MDNTDNIRAGRPSPDALLKLVAKEQRGKLKVFLGAAPGVGKTYAMLAAAERLKAEGVDVAIGLVETHGRVETAALLDGLDVLPRKPMPYRNRTLMEFDLDGALARKPHLLVVDELAHSNPPDSRHPKRYQDVEELLEAGINVWTAVNIQHLESLSDVVSRITGVRVRETIPDTVIENADEVMVVDITPGELIKRLKEGKVYLPENARRAIDKFFKPGNLTALRELALRRTADQVDDEMVSLLRQNAIEGPWPTADRLMVLIGSDAHSQTVVREAARLAASMKASLIAVHVEPAGLTSSDPSALARRDETVRLAERLGRAVGMSETDAERLRYASALHDIGKIGIPDAVLTKPGRLSPQEQQVMRRHTTIGAEILSGSRSPIVALAEVVARTHHERWDGSGYPAGLRGEAIPLAGRITAVCDVFDALLSERRYKAAWSLDAALAELRRERGGHFDPQVLDAFLALVPALDADLLAPAASRGPALVSEA